MHTQQAQYYFDHVDSLIVLIDTEENVRMINRAGCRLLGYHQDRILGRNWFDAFLPARLRAETRQVFAQLLAAELEPGSGYENPVLTAAGEERILRWHNSVLKNEAGEIIGTLSSGEDVTDLARARNALRDSEQKLLEAQRIAQLGRWELDLATNRLEWSDSIFDMFEIDQTVFRASYEAFLDAIHPADRRMVDTAYQESLGNHTPYEITHRLRMQDGRIKWVHEICRTDYDATGRALRSIGTVQDITRYMLLRERIQTSERRFREMFEQAPLPYQSLDAAGNVLAVNEAWMELFGRSREEVLGRFIGDFIAEESRSALENEFSHFKERGRMDGPVFEMVRPDGTRRLFMVNGQTSRESDGSFLCTHCILTDVTDRNRLEQQRLAAEEEHRNTLVREVHHRIKNNLQGIAGVLRQFANKHPEVEALIADAIGQMQCIAVIHGLQGGASPEQICLSELVAVIGSSIESLWKKTVTLEIPPAWHCWVIDEPEAVPLALVLNELVSNAVKHGEGEAVGIELGHHAGTGTVRVSIRNAGRLPVDFHDSRRGAAGTGLQLVASLLPREGARLTWSQEGERVLTLLELAPPAIQQLQTEGCVS